MAYLVSADVTIGEQVNSFDNDAGPFLNGTDLYGVFHDGSTLQVWKSTDGGATWARQDSGNEPVPHFEGRSYSTDYSGTEIHILYLHNSTPHMAIVNFDMATDTWGTPSEGTIVADNEIPSAGNSHFKLIRRATDYVVIHYVYGGNTNPVLCYTIVDGSLVWGSFSTLCPQNFFPGPAPVDVTFWQFQSVILGGSDYVHVLVLPAASANPPVDSLYVVTINGSSEDTPQVVWDSGEGPGTGPPYTVQSNHIRFATWAIQRCDSRIYIVGVSAPTGGADVVFFDALSSSSMTTWSGPSDLGALVSGTESFRTAWQDTDGSSLNALVIDLTTPNWLFYRHRVINGGQVWAGRGSIFEIVEFDLISVQAIGNEGQYGIFYTDPTGTYYFGFPYPRAVAAEAMLSNFWTHHVGPYFDSAGRRILFGPDTNEGVAGSAADHTFRAWESSDEGLNWAELDAVDRRDVKYLPDSQALAGGHATGSVENGATLYGAFLEQEATAGIATVNLSTFDKDTDQWGASVIGGGPEVYGAEGYPNTLGFAFSVVRRAGNWEVYYEGPQESVSGTPYDRVYRAVYSGSWTVDEMLDGQAGEAAHFNFCGAATIGSRAHIFAKYTPTNPETENTLLHWSYSGTFFGPHEVEDLALLSSHGVVSHPFVWGSKVCIAYIKPGTAGSEPFGVAIAESADAPTFDLVDLTPSSFPTANTTRLSLSLAADENFLYLFWPSIVDPGTDACQVFFAFSEDGSTWAQDVALPLTDYVEAVAARGEGGVIAFFFTEPGGDYASPVRYFEVGTWKAPATGEQNIVGNTGIPSGEAFGETVGVKGGGAQLAGCGSGFDISRGGGVPGAWPECRY